MWRNSVLLFFLLALTAEAFVPPAVKGRSAIKGQPRTLVSLQAEPKKKKGVKRKALKKKAVKKKSVQRKAPSIETATVATTETVATTTALPDPSPPPPPPVVATATATTTTTSHSIPLHEIDMPPTSPKPRPGIDTSSLTQLAGGGRPGAIIESEEQLDRKQEIFNELANGERTYDAQTMKDYGTLEEDLEAEYDTDDPQAIDAATLGTWTIRDLQSKFPYEWDKDLGEEDPNVRELKQPGVVYKPGADVDEDGIEIGWDPMFGPSTPQDERTIIGTIDSYMINEKTKDDAMIPPQFPKGDLEIDYNQEVVKFRKSLDIIETYTDAFLPPTMQIPRHVAKWHGYPEPMSYPHKNYTNNRFLEDTPNPTDWSKLDPYQSRRKAVELARAQNAEWLPNGKSQDWHNSQREPYERVGTMVGSLRKAETIDETIVKAMQPALDILGSVAELLSIEQGTVFRFHYHGLMKNRHGMAAWTETLIRDCGVEVTGVVFETGFRRRDQAYEGGDGWYPPST